MFRKKFKIYNLVNHCSLFGMAIANINTLPLAIHITGSKLYVPAYNDYLYVHMNKDKNF